MKITKDPQRQLNLHPLTVYFMLTPEENEEYGEKLQDFNDKKELTFGLFEFQTLVWANNEDDPDLSEEINALQKNNNIMVRLFDDEDGNYQYATQKLKLKEEPASIALSLHTFMEKVYHEDYKLLKNIDEHDAKTFYILYNKYRNRITQQFMPLGRGLGKNLNSAPQWMVSGFVNNEGLTEEQAKQAADKIWEKVEDTISNALQTSKYDHEVTAAIKPVLNGKKKVLGVEFTVDGEVFPFYVSNTESKMILLGTLLRKKMNKPLYLHEFRNNDKRKGSEYLTQNQWIHHLYDIIRDGKNKIKATDNNSDFQAWAQKQRDSHHLSQGKSNLNNEMEQIFIKHRKSAAIAMCSILKKGDVEGRTFYDINLKPENITVSDNFKDLLENFDEWVRTK